MSLEETGFTLFLGLVALACLFIAGKAVDPVMAFHAMIGAISTGAGATFLVHRAMNGAVPAPAEIGGKPNYNFGPVKFGSIMAMFWGVAGFLVGVIIASQLAFPALNLDLPWTSFGRLRPLHTSAVIFAFGGNVLLATSLYVVQRTCQVRMPGTVTRGS
ncbi:hypothetical protein A6302_00277 [Methylobrevis pamukkalensis]|uniref:Uncharacterized protein n=1 Tax=Methylobrevis pamukkalensis TaxID=1439726 RepID=A0A1E3H7Q7_9HYPH|nr:hypothetical protein A6302_00277 [Methylobrevis pamukkalensis]